MNKSELFLDIGTAFIKAIGSGNESGESDSYIVESPEFLKIINADQEIGDDIILEILFYFFKKTRVNSFSNIKIFMSFSPFIFNKDKLLKAISYYDEHYLVNEDTGSKINITILNQSQLFPSIVLSNHIDMIMHGFKSANVLFLDAGFSGTCFFMVRVEYTKNGYLFNTDGVKNVCTDIRLLDYLIDGSTNQSSVFLSNGNSLNVVPEYTKNILDFIPSSPSDLSIDAVIVGGGESIYLDLAMIKRISKKVFVLNDPMFLNLKGDISEK